MPNIFGCLFYNISSRPHPHCCNGAPLQIISDHNLLQISFTPHSATQQEAPPLQHPPPPPVMTLSWQRSLCSSCLPPASWKVGGCQLPLSDFLRLRDYLTIILEYSRDSFQGRTDAPDICYRLVHPEKIQKLYWSTGFDVFILFILKKYNETEVRCIVCLCLTEVLRCIRIRMRSDNLASAVSRLSRTSK